MAVEGIWTLEVYGAFGWERRGILILENGRIIGGGNRHYSVGSYEFSDDNFSADVKIHYFGPPRVMFGETTEDFTTHLSGILKDGVIDGTAKRPDKHGFDLPVMLTRRSDMPSA